MYFINGFHHGNIRYINYFYDITCIYNMGELIEWNIRLDNRKLEDLISDYCFSNNIASRYSIIIDMQK